MVSILGNSSVGVLSHRHHALVRSASEPRLARMERGIRNCFSRMYRSVPEGLARDMEHCLMEIPLFHYALYRRSVLRAVLSRSGADDRRQRRAGLPVRDIHHVLVF